MCVREFVCVLKCGTLCEVWCKHFKYLCDSGNEQLAGWLDLGGPDTHARIYRGFEIVHETFYRPLHARYTNAFSLKNTLAQQVPCEKCVCGLCVLENL